MEEQKLRLLEAMDEYLPEVDGVVTCMHNYCMNCKDKVDLTAMVPQYKRGHIDTLPYRIIRCKSTFLPFVNMHYGSPLTDENFKKQIFARKYDIVHIHSPFIMSKFAIKVAQKQNIPIVATFHTNFRSIFQDLFKVKWLTESIIKSLGDVYNKCDEIFVCSPKIAEQARSFGYTGKITYLPFGSDYELCKDPEPLKLEAEKRFGLSKDDLVFLYTGRIMPLKRIDFIIDALHMAKEKGLEFKFFIAGKGLYRETLEKQVNDHNMNEDVKFLGFVPQKDLEKLYARTNLFLFPSLYDNFGLVKVESAAYWTPGIYIKDSQAGYGVTDGVNGFLTDDNVEAFCEGILNAVADREKLDEIGKNASKDLYISWADCTDLLIKRLKEIVEEKKNSIPVCNQKKTFAKKTNEAKSAVTKNNEIGSTKYAKDKVKKTMTRKIKLSDASVKPKMIRTIKKVKEE